MWCNTVQLWPVTVVSAWMSSSAWPWNALLVWYGFLNVYEIIWLEERIGAMNQIWRSLFFCLCTILAYLGKMVLNLHITLYNSLHKNCHLWSSQIIHQMRCLIAIHFAVVKWWNALFHFAVTKWWNDLFHFSVVKWWNALFHFSVARWWNDLLHFAVMKWWKYFFQFSVVKWWNVPLWLRIFYSRGFSCDTIQDSIYNKSSVWIDYIESRNRLIQFEIFVEHWKLFILEEKNIVLNENSVKGKQCINRESKSLDLKV